MSGFSISNGAVKLTFNSTNHLSSWTELHETHTIHHDHMQYLEEVGTFIVNDCDGSNVYVFLPDKGRNILTPKVRIYSLLLRCYVFHVELQITTNAVYTDYHHG